MLGQFGIEFLACLLFNDVEFEKVCLFEFIT